MADYGLIYGKKFDLPNVYQPVFGIENQLPYTRQTEYRLKTILEADKTFNNNKILTASICDIGCNLGYFTMSLEQAGCTGKITGVDIGKPWTDAAQHIANTVGSKCTFIHSDVKAEVLPADIYILQSVTHHLNRADNFDAMRPIFKKMLEYGSTIYIEQATHQEPEGWARSLLPPCNEHYDVNPIQHFMDEIAKACDNNVVIRLVGSSKNEHLNTIRPIFQIKKKISEELVDSDGNKYQVFDRWNIPYLYCVNPVPNEKTYFFATDKDGKEVFIKRNKLEGVEPLFSEPIPIIKGIVLSNIISTGILPFFNKKKIYKDICLSITEMGKKARELYTQEVPLEPHDFIIGLSRIDDFRLWNIIVDFNNTAHLIDTIVVPWEEDPNNMVTIRDRNHTIIELLMVILNINQSDKTECHRQEV